MSPTGLFKRGESVITPLPQTVIQAMCQHGFSPRTQQSYLYVVTELAGSTASRWLTGLFQLSGSGALPAPASCRIYLHGIRFLYLQVLHWAHFDVTLAFPKRPQRIPELLTRQEVSRLLSVVSNPKPSIRRCCLSPESMGWAPPHLTGIYVPKW